MVLSAKRAVDLVSAANAFSSVAEKKHSFAEDSNSNPKWGTGFEEPGGGSMTTLVPSFSHQKKFSRKISGKIFSMKITLSIGGYPICGAVGPAPQLKISVGDCWETYHKWVTGQASGPLCVLRTAQWTVNGWAIPEPKAWFLVIS